MFGYIILYCYYLAFNVLSNFYNKLSHIIKEDGVYLKFNHKIVIQPNNKLEFYLID